MLVRQPRQSEAAYKKELLKSKLQIVKNLCEAYQLSYKKNDPKEKLVEKIIRHESMPQDGLPPSRKRAKTSRTSEVNPNEGKESPVDESMPHDGLPPSRKRAKTSRTSEVNPNEGKESPVDASPKEAPAKEVPAPCRQGPTTSSSSVDEDDATATDSTESTVVLSSSTEDGTDLADSASTVRRSSSASSSRTRSFDVDGFRDTYDRTINLLARNGIRDPRQLDNVLRQHFRPRDDAVRNTSNIVEILCQYNICDYQHLESVLRGHKKRESWQTILQNPRHRGHNPGRVLKVDYCFFSYLMSRMSGLPMFNDTNLEPCLQWHLIGACAFGEIGCRRALTHKRLSEDCLKAMEEWIEESRARLNEELLAQLLENEKNGNRCIPAFCRTARY